MILAVSLAATSLLIVAGTATAAGADDFPYGQTLSFAVYRNGQPIGRHTLAFQHEGANRTVSTVDRLRRQGAGRHRLSLQPPRQGSVERRRLAVARHPDRRQRQEVHGARPARRDGLTVERQSPTGCRPRPTTRACSADRREVLPAGMLPTSHWNVGQVGQSVLLNTQYGTQSHIQVTHARPRDRSRPRPAAIEATHYRYTGDITHGPVVRRSRPLGQGGFQGFRRLDDRVHSAGMSPAERFARLPDLLAADPDLRRRGRWLDVDCRIDIGDRTLLSRHSRRARSQRSSAARA